MKEGNYEESSRLYSFIAFPSSFSENGEWVSKRLFGDPGQDVFYDYFFCSLLNNGNESGPYLIYEVKEAGADMANLKERILSDERLKLDTSSVNYRNMMVQFWTEEEIEAFKNSDVNFKLFVSSIKDTAGIFEINKKGVQSFNYSDYNGMNYEDGSGPSIPDLYVHYLKEKQDNPQEWYHYNYEHVIRLNDSVNAVIYSIDTSATACPIEMRHIYHRLVTYGINGNIIDSKIVAYQAGEALATLKFDKDKFTVSEYRRTWRNPYDQNDFDNDLIKTEATGEKHFYINSYGKIGELVAQVNQPVE